MHLLRFAAESKSKLCFACKKPDRLRGCFNCPRSYHPECLDPSLREVSRAEDYACPTCSLLELDGSTQSVVAMASSQTPEPSDPQAHRNPTSPVVASEILIHVDQNIQSEEMKSLDTREELHDSNSKPIYLSDQSRSNNASTTIQPSVATRIGIDDDASSEKPRRVKLPDRSADVSHPQLLDARSTTRHPSQKVRLGAFRFLTGPRQKPINRTIISRPV